MTERALRVEIIGDPGSGKTTLAAVLEPFLRYHGFRVDLDDERAAREVLHQVGSTRAIERLASMTRVSVGECHTEIDTMRPLRASIIRDSHDSMVRMARVDAKKRLVITSRL
jgi:adenylylsulfate kinase-like enzyme